jgi:hypothetical protein
MKTVILLESQVKNVIDRIISEQNEVRAEALTVNFDAVWSMGMWKLTSQQSGPIIQKLMGITDFINKNKGSAVTIQIEAGESQVTNVDNEDSSKPKLQPGVLSQRRGESMVNFLTQYFQGLVTNGAIDKMPVIPAPITKIGTTPYKAGTTDLQTKKDLYQQEQFVRAIISAKKDYECLLGMEITIGYYQGKNTANHECDEAIFEIRMNGVALGIVNLNNSTLDMGIDYVRNNFQKKQTNYEKTVSEFERLLAAGVYKERERKKMVPEKPVIEWPQSMRLRASQLGYKTIEPFIEVLENVNNSFKEYGRKTDGKPGGNRSQTFILDGAKAKSIIDNSPSDKIILSIIPLVSKDGKYKIFYQTGTHADTPWVTINSGKSKKTLFDGEPNLNLKRGATTETVLLQTDLCGNPIKTQQK